MPIETGHPGYESSGASIGRAVLYGGILFLLAAALALIASGAIAGPDQEISALPTTALKEPALQIRPRDDLQEMRAREEERLHSYGWVDKKTGVVHIPIERAIELTIERGLPVSK